MPSTENLILEEAKRKASAIRNCKKWQPQNINLIIDDQKENVIIDFQ